MDSFEAKIGWKRMWKRENKNYHYVLFLPDAKFKNLKNAIIASFQAKIGWKMLGKKEYENYRSISFEPDAKKEIPKKQQKNSKI